jgi:hypothetical protein
MSGTKKLNWKNQAELEKKPSRAGKKLGQIEKTRSNWFEPDFILLKLNQTKTNQFELILIFLKKYFNLIIFLNKNQTKYKILILISRCFL